jgi:hypothetical protein
MRESNPEDAKIKPRYESERESSDEPLFILKYRREKLIKRLMLFLCLLGLFGLGAFDVVDVTDRLLVRVAGVIGLCISIPFFLDLLLFREVRLHKDRMVKIWNFIGKREVKLADARLRCYAVTNAIGRFRFGPSTKYMFVSARWTNVIWAEIVGISYDEMLADQDDVKKLNTLLADLTGRKVEEFEQPIIRIERLIEQEYK